MPVAWSPSQIDFKITVVPKLWLLALRSRERLRREVYIDTTSTLKVSQNPSSSFLSEGQMSTS